MSVEQEISQLFPQAKKVTVKGKPFIIKPFGFGQFPAVLKLLDELKTTNKDGEQYAPIPLIMHNIDKAVEMCKLATDQNEAFFKDVPADQAVELCMTIIEVNRDFFLEQLQPMLEKVMVRASALAGDVSLPS